MPSFVRDIGAIVREKRLEIGYTQKQLAMQAGVSERLLRSLEMGEACGIGLDKLVSILAELDLELRISGMERSSTVSSQSEEYSNLLMQAVASWKQEAPHA